MNRKLVTIATLAAALLLSGCATTTGKDVVHDFLDGAIENNEARAERDRTKLTPTKESDGVKADAMVGILNVFFQTIARAFESDDKN